MITIAVKIQIRVYIWLFFCFIEGGFSLKGNTAESEDILVNAIAGDGIMQHNALPGQTGEQMGTEFGASPAEPACPSKPIRALAH